MANGSRGTDETREAIMRATFEALRKHGYAGLSIQRIADETDLSKSTFYHHFDGKEDLLLAFLEYLLDEFLEDVARSDTGDPREDLALFFDALLFAEPPVEALESPSPPKGDLDAETIKATVIELRAHAVRDQRYREQFTETDGRMVDRLADIIERGIETGTFRDVDAVNEAEILLTLAYGALLRPSTAQRDAGVREAIREFVDVRLRRDL